MLRSLHLHALPSVALTRMLRLASCIAGSAVHAPQQSMPSPPPPPHPPGPQIVPGPLFLLVRWRKRKNKEAAAIAEAEAEAARQRMQSRVMRPGSKSFSLKPGGSAADIMVGPGAGLGGKQRFMLAHNLATGCLRVLAHCVPCWTLRDDGSPTYPQEPLPRLQVMSGSAGGLAGYAHNGRLQSWSGSPERMYGQQYQGQYAISRATSVTSMGSALPVRDREEEEKRHAGVACDVLGGCQPLQPCFVCRDASLPRIWCHSARPRCGLSSWAAIPSGPPPCSRPVLAATCSLAVCPRCLAIRVPRCQPRWCRPRGPTRRSCRQRAQHAARKAKLAGSRAGSSKRLAAPSAPQALHALTSSSPCMGARDGWLRLPDWPCPSSD